MGTSIRIKTRMLADAIERSRPGETARTLRARSALAGAASSSQGAASVCAWGWAALAARAACALAIWSMLALFLPWALAETASSELRAVASIWLSDHHPRTRGERRRRSFWRGALALGSWSEALARLANSSLSWIGGAALEWLGLDWAGESMALGLGSAFRERPGLADAARGPLARLAGINPFALALAEATHWRRRGRRFEPGSSPAFFDPRLACWAIRPAGLLGGWSMGVDPRTTPMEALRGAWGSRQPFDAHGWADQVESRAAAEQEARALGAACGPPVRGSGSGRNRL